MATGDLEARIAEVLAYQHCRMTNSKADHPIFGYHAFSEEQREYLRSVMMPSAQAVAELIAPLIREAQADALREAVSDFEAHVGVGEFDEQTRRNGIRHAHIEEAWQFQSPYMDWLKNRAEKLAT